MGQDNQNNFLAYINNPLDMETINMFYKENDINYEKCELFGDFTLSVIITMFDTYMGDDVTDMENQIKHFNWVWDKTILSFSEEGFYFDNTILYEYFLQFAIEVFYIIPNKEELNNLNGKIIKLWKDVFDYKKIKTNSDIDFLIEIYKIYEESLIVL